MKATPNKPRIPAPAVWYLAAGYKLPAGIEAYLLHYATEMRNQGFNPRIIVFEPLPEVPHRFLGALRERGIPIESLYERVQWRAKLLAWATYVPWRTREAASGKRQAGENTLTLALSPEGRGNRVSPSPLRGEGRGEGGPALHYKSLLHYWFKRLAVRELKRMIEAERPDIIHVKGRIITEAMAVLPSERTIYQHALMGTRDPSWTDSEAAAFSAFLNRIARILVQGRRIAETFTRFFNITRPIDVVFTMAPDEVGGRLLVNRCSLLENAGDDGQARTPSPLRGEGWDEGASADRNNQFPITNNSKPPLRFGILCRFTEQKGIAYILEALMRFREKYGAVDFTFAGQGPLESVIREFIDNQHPISTAEATTPHPTPLPQGAREQRGADLLPRPSGERVGVRVPSELKSAVCDLRSAVSPASEVRIVPVTTAVDILQEIDVFVHPGLDDAMPVSIVEALMCGVPCIVSDVGALPELIRDGVEGRVIKPGSSDEIIRAMEWFQERTQDEMETLRRQARTRYEECCTPAIVGAQVAAIYKAVRGKG